jgi:hypothetical protein
VDDSHEDANKPASHRTAVFILIAMTVTIAFFGWQALRTSQLSITSISKPGDYRLVSSKAHPSKRWIHVTGWIDGLATLEIPRLESATIGPGSVEWKGASDWDAGDCVLKYTPRTATMGKLTVDYRIE